MSPRRDSDSNSGDERDASYVRSLETPEESIAPEPQLTEDEAMALAIEAQHASRQVRD